MEKITAQNPLSHSAEIIAENLKTIKSLFPTIVKEGKIDVEELKALLGEEVENSAEYYRFTWAGKSQARQESNKPSTGTLRPVPSESAKRDGEKYLPNETFSNHTNQTNQENQGSDKIFIEGDNLEVLKLLQKSYSNKIKMIYIDPPYNTGKDFVYKDKYADNLGNYLSITGQTDDEGKKLSTNTESDGRYHSNWLNMMYPRLKLARNLLKEEGIIFISIDDDELENLKKLCNEIFGEENCIGCIVRTTGQTTGQDSDGLGSSFDYLLVYSKTPDRGLNGLPLNDHDLKRFENEDEKGKYAYDQMRKTGSNDKREDRPNMFYAIKNPDGLDLFPVGPGGYESCWRFERSTYKRLLDDGYILWKKTKKENKEIWWPYVKYYLEGRTKRPSPLWNDLEGNKKASRDLRTLFEGKKIFDFPKPLELIKRVITISAETNSILLDFFAGSGTTAHATIQLNSEDGGNRKFICVQLPEPTMPESEAYKEGYKNIAEITKERIRRAGKKVKSEMKEDLFTEAGKSLDVGFRVFKLDSSNINAWDGNLTNFEENLLSAAENIKENRTEEDVLYEILLKSGLDLTQPIEEKTIAGKKVFNIGLGALFICLANDLNTKIAEGIGKWKQELNPATCKVIFKDTGFNDVQKTNSIQILKRYGINEVNTI
jgi:adenine-specific DNA-methyltransferase